QRRPLGPVSRWQETTGEAAGGDRRGEQEQREDDQVAGLHRPEPRRRPDERSEPTLAPVIPGTGGAASQITDGGGRYDRLDARRTQLRSEDGVVGLIHEFDRLNAVALTRCDGDPVDRGCEEQA